MKRYIPAALVFASVLLFAGCTKDNYEKPKAVLNGRVVYQGQPVGVRSNGVQLELWQHGFQVFSKIPVYVAQDGTFSASLFDGDYKLVQLRGNGPWVDKTDSLDVQVRGTTAIDVPVTPYFTISNETFQKSGNDITASGKVNKVSSNAIERVSLYLGTTTIVDVTNNTTRLDKTGAAIGDLSQPISFSLPLPATLSGRDYVYARLGVKTSGIGEMIYTQPQKVMLK
jgi:hypothetical protein